MKKIVALGSLKKGRKFTFYGREYRVRRNLGVAGVAVGSTVEREVTVRGRTFTASQTKSDIWSAGSDVVVETREPAEAAAEE